MFMDIIFQIILSINTKKLIPTHTHLIYKTKAKYKKKELFGAYGFRELKSMILEGRTRAGGRQQAIVVAEISHLGPQAGGRET